LRNRLWVWVFVLIVGALASAAQRGEGPPPGEQFVGTWTGTWEGAGSSGGIELTLEKGKDGALTGAVSITGEPAYTATFKTLKFDGKKMTATYDFPPDPTAAEVMLDAAFDGNKAAGGWYLTDKNGGSQVASGTWSVSKK
jgi:hypothetical protein